MSVKINLMYRPRVSSRGKMYLQKKPHFSKLTPQQRKIRDVFYECKKQTGYNGGKLTRALKDCIGDKTRK